MQRGDARPVADVGGRPRGGLASRPRGIAADFPCLRFRTPRRSPDLLAVRGGGVSGEATLQRDGAAPLLCPCGSWWVSPSSPASPGCSIGNHSRMGKL